MFKSLSFLVEIRDFMAERVNLIEKIKEKLKEKGIPIAYTNVSWSQGNLEKYFLKETKGEFAIESERSVSVREPKNIIWNFPIPPNQFVLGIGNLVKICGNDKEASEGYIRINFERKPSYFDHLDFFGYVDKVKEAMRELGITRRRKELPNYIFEKDISRKKRPKKKISQTVSHSL